MSDMFRTPPPLPEEDERFPVEEEPDDTQPVGEYFDDLGLLEESAEIDQELDSAHEKTLEAIEKLNVSAQMGWFEAERAWKYAKWGWSLMILFFLVSIILVLWMVVRGMF